MPCCIVLDHVHTVTSCVCLASTLPCRQPATPESRSSTFFFAIISINDGHLRQGAERSCLGVSPKCRLLILCDEGRRSFTRRHLQHVRKAHPQGGTQGSLDRRNHEMQTRSAGWTRDEGAAGPVPRRGSRTTKNQTTTRAEGIKTMSNAPAH